VSEVARISRLVPSTRRERATEEEEEEEAEEEEEEEETSPTRRENRGPRAPWMRTQKGDETNRENETKSCREMQ